MADAVLCVHSSLRSFGRVEGGPAAVVDGLLDAGCTVLVPTFSWDAFRLPPPPDDFGPPRNGMSPGMSFGEPREAGFSPRSNEVDDDMGAIPREVLARPGRTRGRHPLASFSAVGPFAVPLVAGQRPDDVFAPLRELAAVDGFVLLAGVGLTSMTLLHLAEQEAGRAPFVRWAVDEHSERAVVMVGGCSAGFEAFDAVLVGGERLVGGSRWRFFRAH